MCFPQRLYLHGSVSGCGCIRRVGTCAVIKPFCVERGARSICCRYPWSNPALWPHRRQHSPPRPLPIPPPSKRSYGDSHADTDFPRTSALERWRLEEKGFAQRRWKKCECNISEWESWMRYDTEPKCCDRCSIFQKMSGFNAAPVEAIILMVRWEMLKCQTLQGASLEERKLHTYIHKHEGII